MFAEELGEGAAKAFLQVAVWDGESPAAGTHEDKNPYWNDCGDCSFHPPYFDYTLTHSDHNHNSAHSDTVAQNHSKQGEYSGTAEGGELEHQCD